MSLMDILTNNIRSCNYVIASDPCRMLREHGLPAQSNLAQNKLRPTSTMAGDLKLEVTSSPCSSQRLVSRKLWSTKKKVILLFILLINLVSQVQAQTIQFSIHVSSSLNATKDQDMDFGTVIAGTGNHQINLGDASMGVFAITGNEELDVIVTMTAPANLTTGGSSDVIPFTLKFAYANKGSNDVNQAVVVSGGSARFQMRERETGPAGVPPTPPSSHHIPTEVTAYIYIYGSMNVGSISAGTYTGDVDLDVTYD